MSEYRRLSVPEAMALLQERAPLPLDVRDELSYEQGHVPGARHLSNETLDDILRDTPADRPLLVYCYHGHSSLSAAGFLASRGYREVYSMDGGFEAWRHQGPVAAGED